MSDSKKCSKCKQIKQLSEFTPRKERPGKFRSSCKKCQNVLTATWGAKNKDTISQANRAYYLKHRQRAIDYSSVWRNNNPERVLLQHANERAKKRNLAFDLTLEDIVIPEICPVLGIKLARNRGSGGKDGSPSLDRLDSTKGYVKGNVGVISHRANTIKNSGTIDEHRKVIEYMVSRMPSCV